MLYRSSGFRLGAFLVAVVAVQASAYPGVITVEGATQAYVYAQADIYELPPGQPRDYSGAIPTDTKFLYTTHQVYTSLGVKARTSSPFTDPTYAAADATLFVGNTINGPNYGIMGFTLFSGSVATNETYVNILGQTHETSAGAIHQADVQLGITVSSDELERFYVVTASNIPGNISGFSSGLTVLDSTIFRTYFEYYTVGGAAVPGDHFGEEGIQNFSLLWGIGRLPGLTPEDPLIPNQVVTTLVDIDEDHPLDPGTQVIGSAVTIPVVTEYGINDFVYVDPALAGGYQYEVTGTNFASFIVPNALPGGDDQFSLVFGGNSYSLHAGESFNFTDYAPGGVSKFRLLSIDAGENIDPNQAPPFVSGFKFSDEGVATITQIPVLADSAVPEPSSLALLCIGAVTMVVGAVRRRRQV